MTEEKFFGPGEAGVLEESVNAGEVDLDLLDEMERAALAKRTEALKALLDSDDLELYKIEVMFDRRKTTRGHFPGVMVVFLSGNTLDGGGDEVVYPCPDPENNCQGYITSNTIEVMSRSAYCPTCRKVWRQGDLKEFRFFRLSPEKWAFVLAREFLRTECRASVFMKFAKDEDLRTRARQAQLGEGGGEKLFKARDDRTFVIYTLKNLIKDVNAGASIEARMRALITA